MPDEAHIATDKLLNDLEERIADEYAKAVRDMEKKCQAYFEQFAEQEKKQKALLDAGEITKEDYNNWRFRHEAMGKRWEDMKDVLAADLENARDIALKISGEKTADVYAMNANYAAYRIEHDGSIDAGFTLYNHDTAEYLLKDTRQLMPGPTGKKAAEIAANKAMQWDKKKIQSAVLQGILQGEGPYEVAKRLRDVAQMDYNASVRYARTMITSAQNAGRYESFRRAKRLGIDLTIEWQATLDDRTRHAHRQMHGQRTTVDEPFYTPDGYTIYYPADCTGESDAPQKEIWNCFVGETKVASDCEIIRSYKHEYKGDLIRIVSAAGVYFTCTPNHPILTPHGWIPAARLHKGDNILVTFVKSDTISMEEIHDSFCKLCDVENIAASKINFHGDVSCSEIEVASRKDLQKEINRTDVIKDFITDNIVKIESVSTISPISVFNLQTESGFYFVNENPAIESNGSYYAIAKNCRCTLLGWVKGYEGDTVKESPKMGNMSFDEWLEATPKSRKIHV